LRGLSARTGAAAAAQKAVLEEYLLAITQAGLIDQQPLASPRN